jgi:hypothetical protein
MFRTIMALPIGLMLAAAPVAAKAQTGVRMADDSIAEQSLSPDASAALDRMAEALRALKRFEVRSDATTEIVYENGHKLQFLARATYLVARPDRMTVDLKTDDGHRRIFYDGKSMTLVGMKARKYVRFPVSGSVAEVLERAADDFGIDFPLRDLFLWGSPGNVIEKPVSGFRVGDGMVGDTPVVHYAFRQKGTDFQIWLERGDRPLPRKLVITNTELPEQPQYVAYFTWNTAPRVSANSFTWKPTANFQLVDFGTAELIDNASR